MDYHLAKVAKRGRIVEMRESGKSPTEIARRLGMSRGTVYLWLRRWEEEGNLKDHHRTGMPRKTTAAEDERIINAAEANPFTNAAAIRDDLQLDVSAELIRRRLHERGMHHRIPAEKKPHDCSQCQKSFFWKSYLVQHMTVHTGDKPYECSQYQKTFPTRSTLVKYMAVHMGEKPYECSQCQKTFFQRSNLVRHMNIHRGEKLYECSHCQMTFSQKDILEQHMILHTGKKLYKYSQCKNTSFRRSSVWHMKLHKGEKPFTSNHSDQGFCYKASQTCHPSFHSKNHCDKVMFSQQTSVDHLMSHLATEKSGNPEVVKQEVGAESIIYKTDCCSELASIVPEPFVKTEINDIDIVKEEF